MDSIKNYIKLVRKFRRDLDDRAELSWQEHATKRYVIKNLGKNFCWSKKTAVIYRVGSGIPVFFRSELDCLPTPNGPKHTCGHSLHTAALMATYLFFKKHPPKGFRIYFVFQPSEESFPSGARFISDNFKQIKKCRAGFAFHVQPRLPLGALANPFFASGDYFEIKIRGEARHIKDKNSGHLNDTLVVASDLIKIINSKRSRERIVNIGRFSGGDAPNKIAGEAFLAGDIRTLAETQRKRASLWLKKVCLKYQKRYRETKIIFHHYRGCPTLKNSKAVIGGVKKILSIKHDTQSFGTEDFSFYPVPKAFLLIGTGSMTGLHTDKFKPADKVGEHILRYWIKIGTNLEKII